MKKNLGAVPAVYPMPVLIVAAWDEDKKTNAMNAAWGMICGMDRIALFIDEDHKTTQNLLKAGAFTVSIADRDHMEAADFYGIATGNKMPDKFERSGLHAEKSAFVNAPVIREFPLVMECELGMCRKRQPGSGKERKTGTSCWPSARKGCGSTCFIP